MSKDQGTPRVFLVRHGATEWSRSGRYTGVSDIPLLPEGEEKIRQTARIVFGEGRLIDPTKLARIYVSPRSRAKRTLELMLDSLDESNGDCPQEGLAKDGEGEFRRRLKERTIETEGLTEWGYGDYEGLLPKELKELRKQRGYDKERSWDIWRDGTEGEGSETPEDVQRRVDAVIGEVVGLQGRWMERSKQGNEGMGGRNGDDEQRKGCNVLIVAHGHILRAVVKRWLGLEVSANVELMLEPGGVCGLSYAHGNVEERAVLVGMSFPQP